MRNSFSTEVKLSIPVELYDDTLGLFYTHDFEVNNVPIEGWVEYHPGTYYDAPETDGETNLDIDVEELVVMIEEQDDGRVLGPCRFIAETCPEVRESASERAAEVEITWNLFDPVDAL